METGQRWGGASNPADLTGARQRKLLADKSEREKRAAMRAQTEADADAIRRTALAEGIDAGYDRGFTAGWDALAETLRDAGVDVDSVLALDGEDGE